jgi:hypothetical protein
MVHPQTAFSAVNLQAGDKLPSRLVTRSRAELEAEVEDPWFLGYSAAEDLDNPPPCPYTDGIKARLWRKGLADRVQVYISEKKRNGLATSLT